MLDNKGLKKRIKKNEGFSLKPYKDHLGFLTIGYGHLILSNENYLLKKTVSKKKLEKIFINDFNESVKSLFNIYLKKFSLLLILKMLRAYGRNGFSTRYKWGVKV